MGDFRSNLPLGTTDPEVFYAGNAPNFDEALNTEEPTWYNRFGKASKSWSGAMNDIRVAILNMGFTEVPYAAGNQIDTLTQFIIASDGNAYSILPTVDLPYAITGDWDAEKANFKLVGDQSLRSDLSSSDGYKMVGGLDEILNGLSVFVTPEMFGAKGDGVTDDTDAFSLASIAAYESGLPLITDGRKEYFIAGSFDVFGDADFRGKFIIPSGSDFRSISIKSKNTPTELPLTGLSGLNLYSQKISGLTPNATGKYVKIVTNQILTERDQSPENTPYYKNSAFFVKNNSGEINVSLDTTYSTATGSYFVYEREKRISVVFHDVEIKGSGQTHFEIKVERDSVDLSLLGFTADTGVSVRTLITLQGNDCNLSAGVIDSTEYSGFGYGVSVGLCCDINIDVKGGSGRTNIDGRHGHNVTLSGVSANTVGTHWGNNYRIIGGNVGVITWAGKDLLLSGGISFDHIAPRPDVGCLSLGRFIVNNAICRGVGLFVPPSATKSGFFSQPRQLFDVVDILNLSFTSSSSEVGLFFTGGSSNNYQANFLLPRILRISKIDSNANIRQFVSLPNHPTSQSSEIYISDVVCPAFELIGYGSMSGLKSNNQIKINSVGDEISIRADASSFLTLDAKSCNVVRIRRLDGTTHNSVIRLIDCVVDLYEQTYIESTKQLINCELRGQNLAMGTGSIDGKLTRQTGCVAKVGASGYNPNLSNYVDSAYFIG